MGDQEDHMALKAVSRSFYSHIGYKDVSYRLLISEREHKQ